MNTLYHNGRWYSKFVHFNLPISYSASPTLTKKKYPTKISSDSEHLSTFSLRFLVSTPPEKGINIRTLFTSPQRISTEPIPFVLNKRKSQDKLKKNAGLSHCGRKRCSKNSPPHESFLWTWTFMLFERTVSKRNESVLLSNVAIGH